MKILLLLLRNLFRPALTLRFPDHPACAAGYRGMVQYEDSKCTGCGMCAFNCTSRAIVFRATKSDLCWSYDPAQCTYCGRCVDGCEAGCLSQQADCPPFYLEAGALKRAYVTPRKPPAAPTPAVSGGAL